jgi:hypothetical protein
LLLADAGLLRKRLAPLDGAGGLEQPFGGADANGFQFRSGEGGQASISEIGYVMVLDLKKVLKRIG